MHSAGVDYEVVGGWIVDIGVEMGAYVTLASSVAFGVVGAGIGLVHLLEMGYVPGAMIGRADEADMHAMFYTGGGEIGPAADKDCVTSAGEAAHELIGFLYEVPEVWVQANEFAYRRGDF